MRWLLATRTHTPNTPDRPVPIARRPITTNVTEQTSAAIVGTTALIGDGYVGVLRRDRVSGIGKRSYHI